MTWKPTRKEMFDVLREESHMDQSDQCQHLQEHLIAKLQLKEHPPEVIQELRRVVSRFCSKLFSRWESSNRMKDRFLKTNAEWLSMELVLPAAVYRVSVPWAGGRPKKCFETSSSRSKRRKTMELRTSTSTSELTYATQMSLRSKGKEKAAKLVKEITDTTPTRPEKISKAWIEARSKPRIQPYTEEQALSLIIEAKLTKNQYHLVRSQAKERHADIYPSYHRIWKAKELCYPHKQHITITESTAEVQLQALLDHTVSRILTVQESVITTLHESQLRNVVLITKWGYDGSTGQSEYKQKTSDQGFTDSNLFLTSLVPLQLHTHIEGSTEKIIIWQNPRPASTRYCRPIRLQFLKETADVSRAEKDYIESQIENLQPSSYSSLNREFSVSHQLLLTMIDGKVCNAITTTASAQTCYVCGATPKQMNNIEQIAKREVDVSTFTFGLSTLHAWIRFFECLLHISYRLDVKTWQIRGTEHQTIFKERKKLIQNKFRNEMGLLVDQPKPGGRGTTNDGNTARRFFKHPKLSGAITGINESLISRFAVILQSLSSDYDIDTVAFDTYTLETAKLYVTTYPWYYMPASVHKILLHGSAIISAAMLPIGQLSEEAQEARNKDCKNYRERFTRKCSRIATNQDLFNNLLLSSDPVISSLRRLPRKPRGTFSEAVLALLKSPEALPTSSSMNEEPENSDAESSSDSD